MTWKIFYKQQFHSLVTAPSQYEAIDRVYTDLQAERFRVNRRDIVAIPEHRTWKKATAQQKLFRYN